MPPPAQAATGQAREAAATGDWHKVFELLVDSEVVSALEPQDLELLGDAAFWTGRLEACLSARERAYDGFSKAGDNPRAARLAMHLALLHGQRDALAVAAGWFGQAESLLDGAPLCEEHGQLEFLRAVLAVEALHDLEAGLAHAERAVEIGEEVGSQDIVTLGRAIRATVLVQQGQLDEGVALLDRAMTLAVSGSLGTLAAASIYCGTMGTCTALGDYRRAAEWTAEVRRRAAISGQTCDFPGDCRIHLAEVLRLQGAWSEAEVQAARACDELGEWDRAHLAIGLYELGELSLRRGDIGGAIEAFAQSEDLGHSPQPGRAFVELLRGRADAALGPLREALEAVRHNQLSRAQLLPAVTELALAVGDQTLASATAEELVTIAERYPTETQQARAAYARGRVQMAVGATEAVASMRDAVEAWHRVGAPYEEAHARENLGLAVTAAGDEAAGTMHLQSAFEAFERLGAGLDAVRVAELLGPVRSDRVVRTFVFTDVEDSTSLLAQMGDDEWARVLAWHDSTVRQLVARHSGEEVKQRHGGDGFFLAFASVRSALDCAAAIREAMTLEQPVPDVSLMVRIGVHEAEVTHTSADYSGRGVHEAARIAALASGGEVLVSTQTLRSGQWPHPTTEARWVSLRGLPGETEVASLTG